MEKKSKWKKWHKVTLGVIGAFFLLVIIAVATDDGKEEVKVKSATDVSKSFDIETSAIKYYADYQNNEIKADDTYKGKKIKLDGKVESINKDIAGDPFIVLNVGALEMGVHILLHDSKTASTLNKGQHIVVIGEGNGMTLGTPSLTECQIISK